MCGAGVTIHMQSGDTLELSDGDVGPTSREALLNAWLKTHHLGFPHSSIRGHRAIRSRQEPSVGIGGGKGGQKHPLSVATLQ